MGESVITREPKDGDKQSCLVTQALSHGSCKGRAELKPAWANSMQYMRHKKQEKEENRKQKKEKRRCSLMSSTWGVWKDEGMRMSGWASHSIYIDETKRTRHWAESLLQWQPVNQTSSMSVRCWPPCIYWFSSSHRVFLLWGFCLIFCISPHFNPCCSSSRVGLLKKFGLEQTQCSWANSLPSKGWGSTLPR